MDQIIISCPAMNTYRVSATQRVTSEIGADTTADLPDGTSIRGVMIFPACKINKVFGLLWQVEAVTAAGFLSGLPVSLTLKPEWTFGPLALPCKATGQVWLPDRRLDITARFPFVWASWAGPGKWTVAPCVGKGIIVDIPAVKR